MECPALVVRPVVLGVDVTWLVLVTCAEDEPGVLVECNPLVVLGVDVTWLVLGICDEDDPGVELTWLELLPCVDKDELRVLVECPPLVVRPVLVCDVLVAITDVVWVVSVV